MAIESSFPQKITDLPGMENWEANTGIDVEGVHYGPTEIKNSPVLRGTITPSGSGTTIYRNQDGSFSSSPTAFVDFNSDSGKISINIPRAYDDDKTLSSLLDNSALSILSANYKADKNIKYQDPYDETKQIDTNQYIEKLNSLVGDRVTALNVLPELQAWLINKYGGTDEKNAAIMALTADDVITASATGVGENADDDSPVSVPNYMLEAYPSIKNLNSFSNGFVKVGEFSKDWYNVSKGTLTDKQANDIELSTERALNDIENLSPDEIARTLAFRDFLAAKDPNRSGWDSFMTGLGQATQGVGQGIFRNVVQTLDTLANVATLPIRAGVGAVAGEMPVINLTALYDSAPTVIGYKELQEQNKRINSGAYSAGVAGENIGGGLEALAEMELTQVAFSALGSRAVSKIAEKGAEKVALEVAAETDAAEAMTKGKVLAQLPEQAGKAGKISGSTAQELLGSTYQAVGATDRALFSNILSNASTISSKILGVTEVALRQMSVHQMANVLNSAYKVLSNAKLAQTALGVTSTFVISATVFNRELTNKIARSTATPAELRTWLGQVAFDTATAEAIGVAARPVISAGSKAVSNSRLGRGIRNANESISRKIMEIKNWATAPYQRFRKWANARKMETEALSKAGIKNATLANERAITKAELVNEYRDWAVTQETSREYQSALRTAEARAETGATMKMTTGVYDPVSGITSDVSPFMAAQAGLARLDNILTDIGGVETLEAQMIADFSDPNVEPVISQQVTEHANSVSTLLDMEDKAGLIPKEIKKGNKPLVKTATESPAELFFAGHSKEVVIYANRSQDLTEVVDKSRAAGLPLDDTNVDYTQALAARDTAAEKLPQNIVGYIDNVYLPSLRNLEHSIQDYRADPAHGYISRRWLNGIRNSGEYGENGQDWIRRVAAKDLPKGVYTPIDRMAGTDPTIEMHRSKILPDEDLTWPDTGLHVLIRETAEAEAYKKLLESASQADGLVIKTVRTGEETAAARNVKEYKKDFKTAIHDGLSSVAEDLSMSRPISPRGKTVTSRKTIEESNTVAGVSVTGIDEVRGVMEESGLPISTNITSQETADAFYGVAEPNAKKILRENFSNIDARLHQLAMDGQLSARKVPKSDRKRALSSISKELQTKWFVNGDVDARNEIADILLSNSEARDAALSNFYDDWVYWQEAAGKEVIPYGQWLDTEVTLKRAHGPVESEEAIVLSFDSVPSKKSQFKGEITEIKIKPKDTLGRPQTYGSNEYEVFVPTGKAYGGTDGKNVFGESMIDYGKIANMKQQDPGRFNQIMESIDRANANTWLEYDKEISENGAKATSAIDQALSKAQIYDTGYSVEAERPKGKRGDNLKYDLDEDRLISDIDYAIDGMIDLVAEDNKSSLYISGSNTLNGYKGSSIRTEFEIMSETLSNENKKQYDIAVKKIAKTIVDNQIPPKTTIIKGNLDNLYKKTEELVRDRFDSRLARAKNTLEDMGEEAASDSISERLKKWDTEIMGYESSELYVRTTDENGEIVYKEVTPALGKIYNKRPIYKPMGTVQSTLANFAVLKRISTTNLNPRSFAKQSVSDPAMAWATTGALPLPGIYTQTISAITAQFGERIAAEIEKYDPRRFANIQAIAEREGIFLGDAAVRNTEAIYDNRLPFTTMSAEALRQARVNKYGVKGRPSRKTLNERVNGGLQKVSEKLGSPNDRREIWTRKVAGAKQQYDMLSRGYNYAQAEEFKQHAVNNATTNFRQKHAMFNALRSTTPYLTAGISGAKSFWKMFELDPLGVTTRILTGFVMPIMYFMGEIMEDDDLREQYNNLAEYEKQDHIIIAVGGELIRIPIGEELGTIVNPIMHIVENTHGMGQYDFWLLMLNDVVGFYPVDLTGFTDPEMWERISGDTPSFMEVMENGISSVLSSTMPPVFQSAYMVATGRDLFTGKTVNTSHITIDNEGRAVVESYSQSEFAKGIANIIGGDARVIEKVTSGIFGTTALHVLDTITSAVQYVGSGGKEGSLTTAFSKAVQDISSPYATVGYSSLNRRLNNEINNLYDRKAQIEHSEEYEKYNTEISKTTDSEKRRKLIAKRNELFVDFQNSIEKLVSGYRDSGGSLNSLQFSKITSLLTFEDAVRADRAYAHLNTEYSDARAQALQTLYDMGITNPTGASMLGYIYYDDNGEAQVKVWTPAQMQIIQNALYQQGDIYQAHIQAIIEDKSEGSIKNLKKKEESAEQPYWDKYNSTGKLSNAEWDAIDDLRKAYNSQLVIAIRDYVDSYGAQHVLNDETVLDYLENIVKVPSEYEKVNGRYISSGDGKLNKQQGFARSYLKTIFKV